MGAIPRDRQEFLNGSEQFNIAALLFGRKVADPGFFLVNSIKTRTYDLPTGAGQPLVAVMFRSTEYGISAAGGPNNR